ncbi:MAG: hypothetical protein QM594_04270 [Niabella sp.]
MTTRNTTLHEVLFIADNASRPQQIKMTRHPIILILNANKISKRLVSPLLALLLLLCLESCEGYKCADGTVIDKATNLPLDSVLVEVVTAGSRTIYTDTSGKFDVCNRMGGCVPNCKDIMVKFSKNNYKTVTLTNPEKDAIVIMDKVETD